jgi:hypothetical protein
LRVFIYVFFAIKPNAIAVALNISTIINKIKGDTNIANEPKIYITASNNLKIETQSEAMNI